MRTSVPERQKGQAALELLLVLLILVPLLFGGIELARGVSIRHALSSGTMIGARSLSLDPTGWTWAQKTIEQSLAENVMGTSGIGAVTVQAYDSSGGSITPATLAGLPFGAPFRLEASVDYLPDIPLVGGQKITIRVGYWGVVERYP